jgi:TolA-binding protein
MHRPSLLSALPAGLLAAALLLAPTLGRAQAESREGIYLQNQILEMRQELEQLRASGAGRGAPPAAAPRGGAPAAGQNELVAQLLDRVNQLEDEVRRSRGRVEQLEFRSTQQQQTIEKLQGDMDYRLGQLEGRPAGAAPPPAAPLAAPGRPATNLAPPPGAAPAAPAATARPPERAIADGNAALARRDYPAAEAAAREVLAVRNSPRAADAQLLLADALLGKRDFGAAAVAFDDAYKRTRTSPRAPEALLGLANAFIGLGSKREACETLDDLRSNHGQQLRGALVERNTEARRRAGCR